jgi:hypothetical protein
MSKKFFFGVVFFFVVVAFFVFTFGVARAAEVRVHASSQVGIATVVEVRTVSLATLVGTPLNSVDSVVTEVEVG